MSKSQKLLPFEGLRGIAACVVVLGHLRLTFWPGSSAELRHSLESLPPLVARGLRAAIDGPLNGNFSVWLFWIMSAFVLALQFFLRVKQAPATGAAHDYLEEACLRRYPRLLLPVCGSVAFAYAIHAAGWMRNVTVAHALGDLKGTGWLAGFYRFPASALGAVKSAVWESFFAFDMATTYNSNLWTMEKEFYGSLFLFAFLGVLGHRSSRLFAYPIVALVLYQLNLQWLNTFLAGIALCDAYVNRERLTPTVWSFLKPLVDLVCRSRAVAALFWVLIAFGAGFHNAQGVYFLILGCLAIVFSLVSEPSQRMLSSRPFVFLGKISFGLYLIHIPIICSFSCWAFLAISPSLGPNLTALLVSALTFVASIALGYGLYVVADRPALGLSRRLSAFMANPFAPEFKRPGAKGQSYGAGPGGGAGMGHVRAGS